MLTFLSHSHLRKALNSLMCADVPIRNYSLTHSLQFQAGCRKRRLNLALIFLCLLCVFGILYVLVFWGYSIVILCCQYQCSWLPGKTVSEMIYYVSRGTLSTQLCAFGWVMGQQHLTNKISIWQSEKAELWAWLADILLKDFCKFLVRCTSVSESFRESGSYELLRFLWDNFWLSASFIVLRKKNLRRAQKNVAEV